MRIYEAKLASELDPDTACIVLQWDNERIVACFRPSSNEGEEYDPFYSEEDAANCVPAYVHEQKQTETDSLGNTVERWTGSKNYLTKDQVTILEQIILVERKAQAEATK